MGKLACDIILIRGFTQYCDGQKMKLINNIVVIDEQDFIISRDTNCIFEKSYRYLS